VWKSPLKQRVASGSNGDNRGIGAQNDVKIGDSRPERAFFRKNGDIADQGPK
jgi:hypothetical protein